jgi:hypothetical protein
MNGTKECGESFSHDPTLTVEGPMGNLYFRPMSGLQKGQVISGHKHNFDHVTFLWRGSVRLRAWSKPDQSDLVDRKYSAPARILIKKDCYHEFTSLEDQTFADCIYALRDFDNQVTDHWNGDPTPYR